MMSGLLEIIRQLNLEEKAALLSGKTQWRTRSMDKRGIPSLVFSDGPHGIRRQMGHEDNLGLNPSLPATCFPTASAIAHSFDTELLEEIGRALGEEAAAQGVDVLLGPGLNIKRSPLCGRNFEYYAEDPFLSGKLAAAQVRGVQQMGISACIKHYAVNSQELRRMAMDAVLDERTLAEIYLAGFWIALDEGKPDTVMTSYNEVNGQYVSENKHLLAEILRGTWQFDGLVVTDWGGCNLAVEAVRAGTDLEMPTPGFDSARQLTEAVRAGNLPEEAIDKALLHILKLAKQHEKRKKSFPASPVFDQEAHHRLARRAAEESMVLLKNEPMEQRETNAGYAGGGEEKKKQNMLPLGEGTVAAVIGAFAEHPRIQGGGSSVVNPTMRETVLDRIPFYPLHFLGYAPGYPLAGKNGKVGEKEEKLAEEALSLATRAEVVLYYMGLPEACEMEGFDRKDLRLPRVQTALLKRLSAVNPNIVVLLSCGSVVETDWMTDCKALLYSGLSGQAEASAVLNLLCGRCSPSGRLAETWPLRLSDTPCARYFPSPERTAEYREGLYVGYRFYETVNKPVRWHFGYGLSYTDFSYRDFEITKEGVRFVIKNTGNQDGAEIAQLYVGKPNHDFYQPRWELAGFARVFLHQGEEKEVQIPFWKRSFQSFSPIEKKWVDVCGTYQVMIGKHVAEPVLSGCLKRAFSINECEKKQPCETGTRIPDKDTEIVQQEAQLQEKLSHYRSGDIQDVPDAEFAALLGFQPPDGRFQQELEANDAIMRLVDAKNPLARLIGNILLAKAKQDAAAGKPDLNLMYVANMPFRGIAKMTGGHVSMEMAEGIVDFCNGHLLRAFQKIVGGAIRNARTNRYYRNLLSEKTGK